MQSPYKKSHVNRSFHGKAEDSDQVNFLPCFLSLSTPELLSPLSWLFRALSSSSFSPSYPRLFSLSIFLSLFLSSSLGRLSGAVRGILKSTHWGCASLHFQLPSRYVKRFKNRFLSGDGLLKTHVSVS